MPHYLGGGGVLDGDAIANDALTYKGHPYFYSGAPGADGKQPWDCSSFCNWVLGHDFQFALPGGLSGYDGSQHGPSTLSYLIWGGANRISRGNIQAGDLCVWQTHMGIAINNTQMISAENPKNGTRVSNIDGFMRGEVLMPMRVKGIPAGAAPLSGSSSGSNPSAGSSTSGSWEKIALVIFGALIILVAMSKLGKGGEE